MVLFKSKWADLIVEVGSISIDVFEMLYHEFVVSKVKKVNNDVVDISLLRYLCNILENALSKKQIIDGKINKKDIVINEYLILKPQANNDVTKAILNKIIEDLHNTGQILKLSKNTKLLHKIKSCIFSSNKK